MRVNVMPRSMSSRLMMSADAPVGAASGNARAIAKQALRTGLSERKTDIAISPRKHTACRAHVSPEGGDRFNRRTSRAVMRHRGVGGKRNAGVGRIRGLF